MSLLEIFSQINSYDYDPININGTVIKPDGYHIIAGPCTIESKTDLEFIAGELNRIGVHFIRGGAFKLRTNANAFCGLGTEALGWLKEIGEKYNLITVSELTDISHLDEMTDKVDILLVGTRNMLNYPLLTAVGKSGKPVILKRGMSSTVGEWLQAAEYILKEGNSKLILCERGIRTFDSITRNTYDITAIPLLRQNLKFPIIGDPSHATGLRELIKSVSLATVSIGASGLMVEAHNEPESVKVDARQTIDLVTLEEIVKQSRKIVKLLN